MSHRDKRGDDAGARFGGPVEPQLDVWKAKKESHEQLAVGDKPKRSKKKMKRFVDGAGKKIEGGGEKKGN